MTAQENLMYIYLSKYNMLILDFKFVFFYDMATSNYTQQITFRLVLYIFFFLVIDMLWKINTTMSILAHINFAFGKRRLHLNKCFEVGIQGYIRTPKEQNYSTLKLCI